MRTNRHDLSPGSLSKCAEEQSSGKSGYIALAAEAQWVAASTRKLKGCMFNSQSGRMPGLRVQFPVGCIREAADLFLARIGGVSLPLNLSPSPAPLKSK